MDITKVNLTYTDTASADTEIKYTLVNAGLNAPKLLLLIFPTAEGVGAQKRVFTLAKKIIKKFKDDGKVSFFLTPENVLKEDTVSKYAFDVFPLLKPQLPEIESGFEYTVVKF